MKQLKAKAFEWTSVTGKKLQYIRISNDKDEILINVGLKTYEGVLNLEKEPAGIDEKKNGSKN